MAKISLSRVKEHNLEVASKGVGKETITDIRDTVTEEINGFCKSIQEMRQGISVNKQTGNKRKPRDISFATALKERFGFKDVGHFLAASFGIYANNDSLGELAARLGNNNLNALNVESLMISHSENASPMATSDIDSTFRFIIPEIMASAIRTGYINSAQHQKWIGSTQNMTQQNLVMPRINRGDGVASKVNEGANIPMGSLSFGKKSVNVFKIGTGFKLTDELVMASSLDMLSIFLSEVGNDMSIGADSLAFLTLLNGEQADLSESAPVVGVLNTASGFTYKDVKKVFTRMTRMNQPATRMITGEDDGVDITGIDRFEGFQGQSKLSTIRSIIGVPESFDMDTYVLPANKILYLNAARAMVKLQYRGMLTEKRRNPQNQTEETYVSDWINFAIIKRDARVVQDKSVTIGAAPFPSYMDIDTRISETYNSI